ncbi:MAG: diguanylate cyclase [Nitrospirae bacterium]|nr:diguanylate cyclase [Nitrospirota bacterium]
MNTFAHTLNILLVEDSTAYARLLREMLSDVKSAHIGLIHTTTLSGALSLLGTTAFDVVLLDMTLPDSVWPNTLVKVVEYSPGVPVVVLTSLDDEIRAVNAVQKGAQDYLVKGSFDGPLIGRTIQYAIERQRFRTMMEETSQSLRDSELRLRTIVTKSADGVIVVNKKGDVRFVNPMAKTMFNCTEGPVSDYFRDISSNFHERHEMTLLCWNGEVATLEIMAVETEWEAEDVFIVTLRDITERRKSEEKIRLAARVMESVLEGIFITDTEFKIQTMNPAFSDITEWSAEELHGRNPFILSAGDYDISIYKRMWKELQEIGSWEGEVWNRRHSSGEVYPAWLNISVIKNEAGVLTNYVGILTDITHRKLNEEHLKSLAHYDVLTGLPNRSLFYDRLTHAILDAHRRNQKLAVMFIDLDDFKPVNDTLGHDIGDRLLRKAAQRLKKCVRESDTVARLGGDEFTVIISDVKDVRDAENVAEKVISALNQTFVIKEKDCFIGASIGISIYPDDGQDAETIIKNADTAMYYAKHHGKNNYHACSGGDYGSTSSIEGSP